MIVPSLEFIIFTYISLCLYYVVFKDHQNLVLLAGSYLFVASWNIQFAVVFLLLTVGNFIAAKIISRKDHIGRIALYGGIIGNLTALVFFKYTEFFVPSALRFLRQLGITTVEGGLVILLPIGLSFFVVQAISYLLDVNRGLVKPAQNFTQYAVFMAYFPRVVSGPIERYREFSPLLEQRRAFDRDNLDIGTQLILQGLIRKVVIANLLFLVLPGAVFTRPDDFSSPELTVWLIVFAFALYNDFVGYTALARGISAFFGIPLSANFNVPFAASSFSEFWQRWHITLSNWLRDYIFMPVTRGLLRRKYSRTHVLSIILPPLATMFVSALWHSVSLSMLVWGLMHGLYLTAERAVNLARPMSSSRVIPQWRTAFSIIFVFTLTSLAWVPFQAGLPETLTYWSRLFSPLGWIDAIENIGTIRHQLLNRFTLDAIILIGLSLILDFAQLRFGEQALERFPVWVQASLINLGLFALFASSVVQNQPPPFVYQGF